MNTTLAAANKVKKVCMVLNIQNGFKLFEDVCWLYDYMNRYLKLFFRMIALENLNIPE